MIAKNEIPRRNNALYIPASFYLMRAPALSAHTFQQLFTVQAEEHMDTSDLGTLLQTQSAATRQQLLEMSKHPQIKLAIAVASSSLHENLAQMHRGDGNPSRMKKAFSSLLRYLNRMSTRPTPFGLFSGVALGFFGEETRGQLGSPAIEHFRTRPDMYWLLAVLKHLETSPALFAQMSVQINPLAYIAGNRVYLSPAISYGQKQSQSISLRATSIVRKVFELAISPLLYTTLCDALFQAFPGATREQVEQLLWQLWEQGLLMSTLHPPLTHTQPAHYLYQQMETLRGAEDVRHLLDEVLTTSASLDTIGIGGELDVLAKLVQIQQNLVPDKKHQPHIQVDSLLSLPSPMLHTSIGDAAARAAELLLRFTPFPQGSPGLQEYRLQFLEKYGPGAEVSVLELLSPELGLDAPSGYFQPPQVFHANVSTRQSVNNTRERVLHTLVQDALNRHTLEVELNEAQIAALETWSPHVEQAPHSLEIYLQVQASSREALDRGQWCAVVSPNPGAPNGGRSFGRFFDLLGKSGLHALQDLLSREEALEPESIFAELSYQPIHARTSNVAIRPLLRSHEIAVGVTPSASPERVIPLDDLVVGVQDNRFYLRSVHLNKKIIVCQLHMLNIVQAPNVCRFLVEIASDGLPMLSSFDWGNLFTAPFLPRITLQQSPHASLVLSPARWNLQTTTIPQQATGSTEARRFVDLQLWRNQWRVPRYVYLTEADNRLLLDLEHPLMAVELFQELGTLKEGQQVVLQEMLPDFEHLWLTDTHGIPYFSEIVVPLLRHDTRVAQKSAIHQIDEAAPLPSTPSQADSIFAGPHVVAQETRVFLPGDTWNYIKLYCTPEQQEEIIAGPLPKFVSLLREQQLIGCWFFLRYADPQPHLRLRIHCNTREQIQPTLSILLSWSHQLATQGMIQRYVLDTYEREVARYGGPAAIDLLEHIFCIDSDICSNLLAAYHTHQLTLDPLAIAIASLDRFFSAWGYDIEHRFQWLQKRAEKKAFRKQYYPERKRYCELLTSLWDDHADPEFITQRNLLHELIAPLENELIAPMAKIHALSQAGQLWVTEEDLLASLAHLHKIRLLDLDASKEQQLYAFWWYTLESIRLRLVQKK